MELNNRSKIIIAIITFVVLVVGGMILSRWNQKKNISQDLPSQNESAQQIRGIVTQVETGKDGVQVELETEDGFYNVTISIIQTEIEGDFEEIKVGAEIEVAGRIIDDMEPPLMIADEVTVLKNKE